MNTPCNHIQEQLIDLLLGQLDPQQEKTVNLHLDSCSVCQSYLEQYQNQEKELEHMGTQITNNLEDKQEKVIHALNTLPRETAHLNRTTWSIIMHSKITKLSGIAAVIIVIAMFMIMNKTAPKAWAIEQTIDALKNIRTVEANCYAEGFGKFKAYLKWDGENWTSFQCLGEKTDGKLFGLYADNMYSWYHLGAHEIYQVNLSGDKMAPAGEKLYSEAIKVAPTILPYAKPLFQTFKFLADEWTETYKIDEQTGRESVFVSCTYEPLSMSFRAVFDIETKLVIRAKVWNNAAFTGTPSLEINEIKYNINISDKRFDFQKRFGVPIVPPSEYAKASGLFQKGCKLEEEQPEEAIKVWQELYERYPDYWQIPEALIYTGIVYKNLKKHDKAIKYHQKVIDEYTYPEWAISDAYYNLGSCYKEMNETAKAINAFERCLEKHRNEAEPVDPEILKRHQAYIKHIENIIKELKESL